jgi:hypothetical protein
MPRKAKSTSNAHTRANNKYNKANTKQYQVRLNLKTDADLIAKMESVPNKLGYIKSLIRADIEKDNG